MLQHSEGKVFALALTLNASKITLINQTATYRLSIAVIHSIAMMKDVIDGVSRSRQGPIKLA